MDKTLADYPFLAMSEGDDEFMQALKTETLFELSMPPHERKLHYIAQDGKAAKNHMDKLTHDIRWIGENIKWMRAMAQRAALDYTESQDDSVLVKLEGYTELIKLSEETKRLMYAEIKQIGEQVRWLRKQYKQAMTKKSSDGSSPPSSPSEASTPNS